MTKNKPIGPCKNSSNSVAVILVISHVETESVTSKSSQKSSHQQSPAGFLPSFACWNYAWPVPRGPQKNLKKSNQNSRPGRGEASQNNSFDDETKRMKPAWGRPQAGLGRLAAERLWKINFKNRWIYKKSIKMCFIIFACGWEDLAGNLIILRNVIFHEKHIWKMFCHFLSRFMILKNVIF